MIVTIDGPAGAGKSSVARELAKRLGFHFLDTGAMYRAVAWAALQADVDFEQPTEVERVASKIAITFAGDTVIVNGQDATAAIRRPDITDRIKYAASNAQVREILTGIQRRIGAERGDLVTEGRDQGTIVFPDAECKIFLTASAEERAKRRHRELIAKGERVTFPEVLESQNQRDDGDRQRVVAPLAKAPDAIEVSTDGMSPEDVIQHLEWLVRSTHP